jgi:glycosyltransferase involved in cell wall biosynthesis
MTTLNPTKILVLALVDPSGNPRPRRIIEALKAKGHHVAVTSFAPERPINIDEHYEIRRPSIAFADKIFRKLVGFLALLSGNEKIRSYLNDLRWGLSDVKKLLSKKNLNWIVVEDIHLLPFAFQIKGTAKIMMDAREFYPEELGHNLFWSITEKPMRVSICAKYLKQCDAVLTVSEGLAERYKNDYEINPTILRSTPTFHNLIPSQMQENRIRMVHHGLANRDRRLESMIEVMSKLDSRFELDIYLTGEAAYVESLRTRAKGNKKINILNPVPFEEIIPTLNRYDIGFCYLEPSTFNLARCLPNKFFEFIQGRLAVIVGPSPDMAPIIKNYGCGVVSDEFTIDSVARCLNALSAEDVMRMKQASNEAAKDLCYEKESANVLKLLEI